MKKLILITGSILFICIMISSYRQSYNARAQASSELNAAGEINEQQRSVVNDESGDNRISMSQGSETVTGGYRIGIYDKKIALFRNEEPVPYYISDVHISTLPVADRSLLENGISVPDRRSLERLLEDYCS